MTTDKRSEADAHHLASTIVRDGVKQDRSTVEDWLFSVEGSADLLDAVMGLLPEGSPR